MEFGSAIHAALEQVLNGGTLPEDKAVRKVLEPWVRNRLPEIKLSRKTEEGISIKDERFPNLKIYGKVDLIENLSGKEVRITDFKTGSAKKKYEIEKSDEEGRMSNLLRQLTMYAYLLEENPKWRADVRVSARLMRMACALA